MGFISWHVVGRSSLDTNNMNQPWQTRFHYDGNGNIQRLYRNGPEIQNGSWKMDSLRYHYDAHKNSLRHVDDSPTLTSHYDTDIDDQNPLNYTYDAVGRMVKDNLSDILRVKWNRMSKPTEIWRTAKPVIRYYFGPDGAKVATFDGSTRVDYVHNPSDQLMAVYETVERGDSVVLPTLNPEGKFLRAVLAGLSDTCEAAAERFMARYITPDCKIGSDSQIMYELGRMSCLGYETISCLSPHVDLSCVGMNIQQSRDFPIDTTATGVVLGTRFSQQWLTEQHLYGSARLGIDRERRLLADSVRVRRAVYNPIVGWWKEVSIIKPLALVYRSDTSAWQANTLGAVHFELPNHLGNVVAVISDRKIAVDTLSPLLVKYYLADRIFLRDYYAFGMTMPGRQWSMDSSYRFGFNGKEGALGLGGLDFGARVNDVRLGRWMSVDPLGMIYPNFSPYVYVANSPIMAIDPDGKKILFVNGHWTSGWSGKLLGADTPGKGYWGSGFENAAARFFRDQSKHNMWIDGSSNFGIDQSGENRYNEGYAYALENLEVITSDLVEGETFKLLSHSEGAAYGAGVAQALIDRGYKVETIVHLSADEDDEFSTPKEPMTYQLGYSGDWITGNYEIENVDRYGLAERADLGWKTIHGSTRNASVFKELNDLKTANLEFVPSYDTRTSSTGVDNTGFVSKPNVQINGTGNGTEFNSLKIINP